LYLCKYTDNKKITLLIKKQNINIWIRYGYGIILGILLNFLLDVIFRLIYKEYSLFQPFQKYIVAIIITYVVSELFFWINRKFNRKFNWVENPLARFIGQFVINSLVAVVIVDGIRLTVALFSGFNSYIRQLDELIIIGYILVITIIYTIFELIIFLLYRWQHSLAEIERFKKENAEFRFEALRSQLNPHFLFNSLNTLSSLVYDNQEKAEQFIRELSDVYRYILENRDKDVVNLSNEIAFAEAYIRLLKVRFDSNLIVNIDNKLDTTNRNIAPLTLQLLIENAIKHNVVSKKHPLSINIIMSDNVIIIRNNIRLKSNKEYSSELGIKNIISRYGFLTEETVEVISTDSEFIVKIPLI